MKRLWALVALLLLAPGVAGAAANLKIDADSVTVRGPSGADTNLQIVRAGADSLEIRTAGTARLIVGSTGTIYSPVDMIIGSATVNPDGLLHLHSATAGAVTPVAGMDDLVIEGGDNSGMSTLTPDASTAFFAWGSPTDSDWLRMDGSYNSGSPYIRWRNGTTERMRLGLGGTGAGQLIIGDGTTTSWATGTIAAYIDQRANDDGAFGIGSSDVAHGITDFATTDAYLTVSKGAPTTGTANVRGFTESIAAMYLQGYYVTDNTTKTTAGQAAVEVWARKKSGTGVTDPGADANLFAIRANSTTRFIFDAEGSGHADVEWTTYDIENDFAVVNDIEAAFGVNGFSSRIYNRDALHDLGLFDRDSWHVENGRQRAMMDWTKMVMLHTGTLNKTARHLMDNRNRIEQVALSVDARLAALESENAILKAQMSGLRRATNFRIASLGN